MLTYMHCLQGKPIAFMQLEEKTHFVTEILCKAPHAVTDSLIGDCSRGGQRYSPNSLLLTARRDSAYHVGKDSLEREDDTTQSANRISRKIRNQTVDSRAKSMLQVPEVRPHRKSMYSTEFEMSHMRRKSPVRYMSKEKGSKSSSDSEVCELWGESPSFRQKVQE